MAAFDPAQALGEVVRSDEARIVRLWSKRLVLELHESQLTARELREPLEWIVSELGRLLGQRGEDAVLLWPEAVRPHGLRRYEQRFEAEDLARELKALQAVILRVYVRRVGYVEPEVAELLAELIGEATAGVQASFAGALRTEEVRFREAGVMETVLHHVDVGILLADGDGRVSFATPPAGRLLGVPVRMLVGTQTQGQLSQVLTQIDARHPDGKPFRPAEMPLRRVLAERVPVRGVWMEVKRLGGRATLELSATPLWEEGDRETIVGAIQTLTDHSDLVETSRALTGASAEVQRLQDQLGAATRGRALGQLASATAHTLSNALNSLRLRLKLMRGEVRDEHLEELDDTVSGLGELVKRLQELAETRTQDQVSSVPLTRLVKEALDVVRPRLTGGDHPLTIRTDLTGVGEFEVRADAGLLRELMYGLMLTARERMPDGGEVRVSVRREEDVGVVRVTDAGGPPDAAALAGLFEPFHPEQPGDAGVSLILTQGRERARRWGGSLSADPLPEGLALTLRLAVTPPEAHPGAAVHEARVPAAVDTSRRVLVVDDDVDNARMLAEVLGDEGYQVRVAHSARDALRLFDEAPFDAALLDAVMPDVSGWELARKLRTRRGDLLLAMVTGMDVRGQSRERLALADAVFRKPVDVGALDEFLARGERAQPDAEGPEVHG